MEQNPTYHKIEAYLDNSLPAAEHEAFEREIARDPELAQQVELQRFERDAMEVLVEEDLRDDIAGWKKDMLQVYVDKNKEAQRIKMKTRRNRFLAIAASFLVILAAGALWWFSPTSVNPDDIAAVEKNRQTPASPQPSSPGEDEKPEDQPIAQLSDPQKKGEEEQEQEAQEEEKETTPQNVVPEIQDAPEVATQDNTLEMAKEAFDDSFLRSQTTTDNEALKALITAYSNNNFEEAVQLAAEVKDPYPLGQEFLAASYFQLGQFEKAKQTYSNLMRLTATDKGLRERTEWHLLMTFLAQGQTNYAEFDRLLNRISGNKEHQFFDEADALKSKMY